jgi:hypothetical protein
MQPDRAKAPAVNPKKLVLSCGAGSLQKRSVLGVLAVPDRNRYGQAGTSGTPGGTLSIAIRTATRCARRTQV